MKLKLIMNQRFGSKVKNFYLKFTKLSVESSVVDVLKQPELLTKSHGVIFSRAECRLVIELI